MERKPSNCFKEKGITMRYLRGELDFVPSKARQGQLPMCLRDKKEVENEIL